MTPDPAKDGKSPLSPLLALVFSALAMAVLAFVIYQGRASQEDATEVIRVAAAHVSAVPPEAIAERTDELAAWVLDTVHKALDTEDPRAIDAQLAFVADGAALTSLKEGLLGKNGLEPTGEGFHEVELLSNSGRLGGQRLDLTTQWRPVGLVAGAQHRHRIGHSYTATLGLSWSGTEWRLSTIAVTDIDRSSAGQIVEVPT